MFPENYQHFFPDVILRIAGTCWHFVFEAWNGQIVNTLGSFE